MISAASVPIVAMAAITAFSGAFALSVYARRKEKSAEIRSFAVTCFVFFAYLVASAGLASAGSVRTGALWQRYQFCAILLVSIALLKFVDDFTGGRVSRGWFRFFAVALAASAAVDAVLHHDLLWYEDVPMIKRFEGPFGFTVVYNEVDVGPVVEVQYLLSLIWLLYLLGVAIRFYRETGRPRARRLILALAILLLCAINDAHVSVRVYEFLYLIDYGYLAIVFVMAHSFVGESVAAEEAIRDRAAIEERLREAEKQEAIGRLAGGVAHDLNNMLTPIIGYVEIARLRRRSPEELMEYLARIGDAAEHSRRLTWQLLAFSRKQMLDLRVVELNAIVSNAEQMLRRLVPANVRLELRLSDRAGHVRADETQLRQMLVNLVTNARDAMPDGGALVVETRRESFGERREVRGRGAVEPGDYAVFSVKDTGQGMDEATAARVFEPFFTTKEQGRGTGLGLATVSGIVRQHGGAVEFFTAVGAGSEFRVLLPAAEAPAAAAGPEPEAPPPPVRPPPGRSAVRVLLVEDEAEVGRWVREVLESRGGFEVVEARTPEEALAFVERPGRPDMDLLLADVLMPGMNGFRLHALLEERLGAVPALFMSGYSADALPDGEEGAGAGGVTLLQKPFDSAKLIEAIGGVLGGLPGRPGGG